MLLSMGLITLALLGLTFGLGLSFTVYYGVKEGFITFPGFWINTAMMLAGLGACVFGLKCIRRDLQGRLA